MLFEGEEYLFLPFKVTEVTYRSFDCPLPRSGHRIVCDDSHVYCFGGYNPSLPFASIQRDNPTWSPSNPLFKELWSFSLATRKWTFHKIDENMPEELASNAMCAYGGCVLIFGGTGEPFGQKCSNDLLVWSPKNCDAKLQILDVKGTRPPGQYGQTILCHNGNFYTIGGTNGYSYNCDIYRLDLQTLVWEPIFVGTGQEDEPAGRYRHEVARVGQKLYIIGGGTGDSAFGLMEVPMFDLDTKTWKMLKAKPDEHGQYPSRPSPRKCHSAVQVDTPNGIQVFVAGGSDGQHVFSDIWRLSIADMQWTLMENAELPNRLYFHSSTVTSSGCMYSFGGIEPTIDYTGRNNIMYKVWLCIPKLSEICFEAILHFQPDIEKVKRQELLKIGFPERFVQRIHPPRKS